MKYTVEGFTRNRDGGELVISREAPTREEARLLKKTLKGAYPALMTVIRNMQTSETVR